MDEICTACLSNGRNLYYIGETGFQHLYTQILNEIAVYEESVCVRVCWECVAMLRRFDAFKRRVQSSHTLLQGVHQNPQCSLHHSSTLDIRVLESHSYPDIKLEVDELEVKGEEHTEVTFVNDLHVEDKDSEAAAVRKKVKTPKVKKKKSKMRKTINIKRESPAPTDASTHSDGVGDSEPLQYYVEMEREKESRREERVENKCESEFDDMTMEVQTANVGEPPPSKKSEVAKRAPRDKEVLAERPECAECGKVFSSRKTYRYHLNVLHKGQNRYPCPRCGKVYQWKSNLGRHMRSHKARDSGELYCALCDKRFASVATHRQHLRVSRRHVQETEFSFMCNECGKKFVNKTRLRDHIDWEHLKKIKFRCQLCNKPFKCHTSLYVHMQNVHRNKEKKDNLCHVCGKSYQNAAKLKYHIVAMHTSETPYQCAQCSAAFGWYSSLYRHVREVHYKMKMQPNRTKKNKKVLDALPPHPGPLTAARPLISNNL